MKRFIIFSTLVLIFFIGLTGFKFLVRAEDKSVFINEFLPDGIGSDSGKEWVELYNLSNQDINLKEWKILTKSSTSSTPRTTSIGDVTIKSKNFLIISEFDLVDVDFLNVGAGKLNMYNSNAEIYILDNKGNKVDSLNYVLTQEGKSLERKGPLDSEECNLLQTFNSNTLGKENSNIKVNCWPDNPPVSAPNLDNSPGEDDNEGNPLGEQEELEEDSEDDNSDDEQETPIGKPEESKLGAQSSIVISEVYPSPNKSLNESEWLEIYNQDIFRVELTGMYLKERAGEGLGSSKTMLPSVVLEPNSFIVIYEKDLKLSLNNSGDTIYLFDANDTIVDNFKFESISTLNSASRKFENNLYQKYYSNNPELNFVPSTTIPTPGSHNQFPVPKEVSLLDLKEMEGGILVKTTGVINSGLNIFEKDTFTIQNIEAGVKVHINFDAQFFIFGIGNEVDVIGITKLNSDGEIMIDVKDNKDIKLIDDYTDMEIADLSNVDNFNMYLNKMCSASGHISKNYGTTFYITSRDKSVKIKVLSIFNITLPTKSVGDWVEVEGILIKEDDIFTLIPLYPKSLKIFSEEEIKNSTTTKKNSKSSTPSTLDILGESAVGTENLSQLQSLQNAGDKLYRADSPSNSENKIYPWPIYFASSSLAIFEFVKTLLRIKKYF